MSELDPRWSWVEERRLCDPQPTYIRGQCNHLEVVPVESCLDDGATLAHPCLTCDAQLPAEWRSPFRHLHAAIAQLRRGEVPRYAPGGIVR